MSEQIPLTDEEIAYVQADNLIHAVRSARNRLNIGLAEAKKFVEERARKIGWKPWSERQPKEERNVIPGAWTVEALARWTAERVTALRGENVVERAAAIIATSMDTILQSREAARLGAEEAQRALQGLRGLWRTPVGPRPPS